MIYFFKKSIIERSRESTIVEFEDKLNQLIHSMEVISIEDGIEMVCHRYLRPIEDNMSIASTD